MGDFLNKIKEKIGLKDDENTETIGDKKFGGYEDLLNILMKAGNEPVDRETFLREVLEPRYTPEQVEKAIALSPSKAGISTEDLKSIANEIISATKEENSRRDAAKDVKESIKEINGDGNLIASVVDTAKDVGKFTTAMTENTAMKKVCKNAQKLLYLYGFPKLNINEKGMMQGAQTKLELLVAIATMFKTENADSALRALAQLREEGFDYENVTELFDTGKIAEILKSWGKKFGASAAALTAAGSLVPVGNLAQYALNHTDKINELAPQLSEVLSDTVMTNPEHKPTEKELEYIEEIRKICAEHQE